MSVPPGGTAEYKQVTVLFADVVGSMQIAAAVDVERLREIITDFVERASAAVHRYGGTAEYNGDGVMALFGAPTALEDHALRGVLAALMIQQEAGALAAQVKQRDGVDFGVRVGLNSGQVIAGEIGAGTLGYRAIGEPVGFAQRMEAVAPAGGVVLSESTTRLVQDRATLAGPEWVRVKGSQHPVCVWRLLGVGPRGRGGGRVEAHLVGRHREMTALDAFLERAIGGHGGMVNLVGPPGIGKSRLAREVAALADARGVEVVWAFCESHASDVPFYAVTRLLQAATGVTDLEGADARRKLRRQFPFADPQDLVLLDDLLGIADPDVPLPPTDSNSRRCRLTALLKEASLARVRPALFIIEDVHWIDPVSESMVGGFVSALAQTRSMVLITSRPRPDGELDEVPDAQPIPLGPLADRDTATMLGELLGADPSVGDLSAAIVDRSAGSPFFAEEMVREWVQRGVLSGERGRYYCRCDSAEITVPATVQSAIEARIDQLAAVAKRTLNAASVIGIRFGMGMLTALVESTDAAEERGGGGARQSRLVESTDAAEGRGGGGARQSRPGVEPLLDELIDAELIERADSEYAFRHPLIREVAYESQLKSDRAQWHRRLAAAVEASAPDSAEENAALIAQHSEAAGDWHTAYSWHMRAAAWSTNRDLVAARLSWERARRIADALPVEDSDRLSMQIAPRTMLCATDWQAREAQESEARFGELRELCDTADDKRSLAIAMTGPVTALMYAGRAHEAARLSSRQMALLEAINDPASTMGLAAIVFVTWQGVFAFGEIVRCAQNIVDLAADDPARGAGYGVGSPLAIALAWRGTARWCLGQPGWRQDLCDAVSLARRSNPETFSGAMAWTYGFAIQYGVLRVDDSIVQAGEDAVRSARAASSDRALGLAAYSLAVALLNRESGADRRRGLELMMQVRAIWLRKGALFLIPVTDVWVARERARSGDREAAIRAMRTAVDELRERFPFYGVWAAGVLVETLTERATGDDIAEGEAVIDAVASLALGRGSAVVEIGLLRMRVMVSRSRGDQVGYPKHLSRYRDMAKSLGFEEHLDWIQSVLEVRSRIN